MLQRQKNEIWLLVFDHGCVIEIMCSLTVSLQFLCRKRKAENHLVYMKTDKFLSFCLTVIYIYLKKN